MQTRHTPVHGCPAVEAVAEHAEAACGRQIGALGIVERKRLVRRRLLLAAVLRRQLPVRVRPCRGRPQRLRLHFRAAICCCCTAVLPPLSPRSVCMRTDTTLRDVSDNTLICCVEQSQ